ncbi:uncharacterized [Tachysurus ichikawai]
MFHPRLEKDSRKAHSLPGEGRGKSSPRPLPNPSPVPDGAQQMSFLSALFIGSQRRPSSDPQRYLQLSRKTLPFSSNSVYTRVIKANEKRPEGFFPSFALMLKQVNGGSGGIRNGAISPPTARVAKKMLKV